MTCFGWTAATGAAAPKGGVVPRNIMKHEAMGSWYAPVMLDPETIFLQGSPTFNRQ
jgi:hypothetical protein